MIRWPCVKYFMILNTFQDHEDSFTPVSDWEHQDLPSLRLIALQRKITNLRKENHRVRLTLNIPTYSINYLYTGRAQKALHGGTLTMCVGQITLASVFVTV